MQLFVKKESKIECSVGKTTTEAQYTKKNTLIVPILLIITFHFVKRVSLHTMFCKVFIKY
jgi:hypothetical protein